jgi:hypothetical protein
MERVALPRKLWTVWKISVVEHHNAGIAYAVGARGLGALAYKALELR